MGEQVNIGEELSHHFLRAVRGSIVRDNDLHVRIINLFERLDGFSERIHQVVIDDDYANRGLIHTLILSSSLRSRPTRWLKEGFPLTARDPARLSHRPDLRWRTLR